MGLIKATETAAALRDAWHSRVLGEVAGASVKIARMDGTSVPEEFHDAAEALVVLDGHLALEVGGRSVPVAAGELYVIPEGTKHSVGTGSHGTLLIIEAQES